jgi:hypothetical protein
LSAGVVTAVFVVAIAIPAGVIGWRRGRRRVGNDEWVQRWKSVEPDRRRRIGRAVRAGRAVDDPRDAALAAEAAARFLRWKFDFKRLAVLELVAAAVLLPGILLAGVRPNREELLAAGAGLGSLVFAALWVGWFRRRAAAAEEANRRLAGGPPSRA